MRALTWLTVVVVVLAATGCGSAQPSKPPPAAQGTAPSSTGPGSPGTNAGQRVVTATFGTDDAATNYDKRLVPNGAKMLVAEYVFDGATTVTLHVRGLAPNHPYGAHAHARACGPKPDDAGPHFQHNPDPTQPSVNPAYANPTNEIWLDFTTDARGDATTAATVPWIFTQPRAASVVIHAHPTETAPGVAGVAGPRLACLSVGF
jgi:Cu-Zn family superoxide dismutase